MTRAAAVGVAAALRLFVDAGSAVAQEGFPVAIEMRGGMTHPVPCVFGCEQGHGGADPAPGPARWLEGVAEVKLHTAVSLFGGYSDYRLRLMNYTATGSGFAMGARFGLGADHVVSPWVRAGAILDRRTFEYLAAPPETAEVTSDRGWGWEAGLGLALRAGPFLTLTPAAGYQTYTAKVGIDQAFQRPMGGKLPYDTSLFVGAAQLDRRLGRCLLGDPRSDHRPCRPIVCREARTSGPSPLSLSPLLAHGGDA